MVQENKKVHMIKEDQLGEALDEKNRSKLIKGKTKSENRKPDQGSWLSSMFERDEFIVDNVEDEEEEEIRRQESVIVNNVDAYDDVKAESISLLLTCLKWGKPTEALKDKGHKVQHCQKIFERLQLCVQRIISAKKLYKSRAEHKHHKGDSGECVCASADEKLRNATQSSASRKFAHSMAAGVQAGSVPNCELVH
ncbi:hypothetical protein F511_29732 [Dorcoceras hygrometricum]|uniref:Uncharacterized protein n=1 Tax=Dorcoceras hygrometricum TaxID=472368 RepID=A0A2Z7CUA4_9LAMI|nr:hypothetical protein F511_29732 [Dorcoceras hygrometricum]